MFLLQAGPKHDLLNLVSQQKNLKGVLFDVDGTLYHQMPVRVMMLALLLSSHFFRPNALFRNVRIIRAYRTAQETLRQRSVETDENGADQVTNTALATGESREYVASVIESWFQRRPLPFIRWFRRRDVITAMHDLHDRGLRMGIYSDYPAREKIKALGISAILSCVVSSQDADVRGVKPHSNGFAIAANKMGLRPHEIIYVGDRLDVDGLGAEKAGMTGIQVTGLLKSRYVWC